MAVRSVVVNYCCLNKATLRGGVSLPSLIIFLKFYD